MQSIMKKYARNISNSKENACSLALIDRYIFDMSRDTVSRRNSKILKTHSKPILI